MEAWKQNYKMLDDEFKNLEKDRQIHISMNISAMQEIDALKQELNNVKQAMKEKCKRDKDEIDALKAEIERLNGAIKSHSNRVAQEHDYGK